MPKFFRNAGWHLYLIFKVRLCFDYIITFLLQRQKVKIPVRVYLHLTDDIFDEILNETKIFKSQITFYFYQTHDCKKIM